MSLVSSCGRITLSLALTAGMAMASAAPVPINIDPFAGSTALATPGRQVFAGQERLLPAFSTSQDSFLIDLSAFSAYGVSGLHFLNAPSSDIPGSGFNVIVLQDIDNDANPATPSARATRPTSSPARSPPTAPASSSTRTACWTWTASSSPPTSTTPPPT